MTAIRGTIKELAEILTLNGQSLAAPELSILSRVFKDNGFTQVGTVPKPEGQKGRSAVIWEVNPVGVANFGIASKAAAATAEVASEGDASTNTSEGEADEVPADVNLASVADTAPQEAEALAA